MAKKQSTWYRGFSLVNTSGGYQDWRGIFAAPNGVQRVRWGTLDELKGDVDAVLDGLGLPAKQRGGA